MPSSTSCSETRKPIGNAAGPAVSQPPLLFGAAVFAFVLFLLLRGEPSPPMRPALPSSEPGSLRVLLGSGFPEPGVHQYSDGMTIASVMELTGMDGRATTVVPGEEGGAALLDGMALSIGNTGEVANEILRGWMPARQRLALGIPLHPDRMSLDDWETLPGIGTKLA